MICKSVTGNHVHIQSWDTLAKPVMFLQGAEPGEPGGNPHKSVTKAYSRTLKLQGGCLLSPCQFKLSFVCVFAFQLKMRLQHLLPALSSTETLAVSCLFRGKHLHHFTVFLWFIQLCSVFSCFCYSRLKCNEQELIAVLWVINSFSMLFIRNTQLQENYFKVNSWEGRNRSDVFSFC